MGLLLVAVRRTERVDLRRQLLDVFPDQLLFLVRVDHAGEPLAEYRNLLSRLRGCARCASP
jgi:hypothetical protein